MRLILEERGVGTNSSLKRSLDVSSSSNQTTFLQVVVGSASKRAAHLPAAPLEVEAKASELSKDTMNILAKLFSGAGVTLDDLSKVANPPIHHQIENKKAPVPERVSVPGVDAKEVYIVYFLCYLAAALVGKELIVHDIQTRRHTRQDGAPDMAVTKTGDLPRYALTANFVFEVKKPEEFGSDDHILQAARYAMAMCAGFSYTQGFVVLASQSKIKFMKVARAGTEWLVSMSKGYELSLHQDTPSEGVFALRTFLLEAAENMTAARLPALKNALVPGEVMPLDVNDLSLLVFKTGSIVYSHVTAASSGILKKVASEVPFQTELQALIAVGSTPNVANLLGFNTNERYMLISPRGDFTVSALRFCDWKAIFGGTREYLQMFKDLLGGLEHVHSLGWIHRDIRPENIIYCGSAHKLVLIDFGLAVQGASHVSATFSGYLKFGAEEHICQHLNEEHLRCFTWNASTDKNALVLVAAFVSWVPQSRELDHCYDSYLTAEDDDAKIQALREFLSVRKRFLVN